MLLGSLINGNEVVNNRCNVVQESSILIDYLTVVIDLLKLIFDRFELSILCCWVR